MLPAERLGRSELAPKVEPPRGRRSLATDGARRARRDSARRPRPARIARRRQRRRARQGGGARGAGSRRRRWARRGRSAGSRRRRGDRVPRSRPHRRGGGGLPRRLGPLRVHWSSIPSAARRCWSGRRCGRPRGGCGRWRPTPCACSTSATRRSPSSRWRSMISGGVSIALADAAELGRWELSPWTAVLARARPRPGVGGGRRRRRGTPGFEILKIEHKMGSRGDETASFALDDVRVPADHLLGGEALDALGVGSRRRWRRST